METTVDVVIIGAGLSGLSAAYKISKVDPSLKLLVLEANGRVGGRTLTEKIKTAEGKDVFDLGGQWIGNSQYDVMELIDELDLSTYEQYTRGKKCMVIGSSVRYYKSEIPSLSWLGLWDLHRYVSTMDAMSKQIPLDDPSACKKAELWDSISLDGFKRRLLWTREANAMIDLASRCVFGIETKQMSLLFFLSYCATAGGIRRIVETGEGTGQQYKIKGGSQQLTLRLREKIGTDNVILESAVISIKQEASASMNIVVSSQNGSVYNCKRVILAVPPNQIGKISFEPGLPELKKELLKRMPMGNLIKFIITYDKAFWRDDGFSGEIVSDGGKTDISECQTGPLCVVYDNSTALGSPSLVGFIGGDQALRWKGTSAIVRRQAVLSSLASCLGDACMNYVQYVEKDWANEPFTGGCPVCSVGVGAMTYFARGLRSPFNRIHFAGTESATRWCGFMNGAVQSGNRSASEVLYFLRPELLPKAEKEEIRKSLFPQKSKNSRRDSIVAKVVKHHVFRWTVGLGTACVLLVVAKKAYFRIAL